jgi:hypothetical protein
LGLNDVEAEVVSSLRTGTALWRVNRRSFLVRHQLTEEEAWIVDADERMAAESREVRNSEGPSGANSEVDAWRRACAESGVRELRAQDHDDDWDRDGDV